MPHSDIVRLLEDPKGGLSLRLPAHHVGRAVADLTHAARSRGAIVCRVDMRHGDGGVEAELRFVDRDDRTLPPPARDALVAMAVDVVASLDE